MKYKERRKWWKGRTIRDREKWSIVDI